MFFRRKVITLGRVRDTITFREGSEEIKLKVDADAASLMAGMKAIQAELAGLDPADDAAVKKAADMFATRLFGIDQADEMFTFYNGDPRAVIRACGEYSRRYLLKRITKAQEKAGRG